MNRPDCRLPLPRAGRAAASSALASFLLASLMVVLVPPSAVPAADAAPDGAGTASPGDAAASWMAGELGEDGSVPGPGGRVDHGLGADVLLGMAAVGSGRNAAAGIVQALDGDLGSWIGPDLYRRSEARIAGATAKALFLASVAGEDPRSFGRSSYLPEGQRYDLRREVLDLLATDGPRAGRVANRGTGRDDTNVFAQSFAVLGLHRSGSVPESSVRYLLSQQCAGGWFRMYFNDDLTCDEAHAEGDGDGTAMALDALVAVRGAVGTELQGEVDSALRDGVAWLLDVQGTDGSFGGSQVTAGGNANSTALVVQALESAVDAVPGLTGSTASSASAVGRGRAWLVEHQVSGSRPADADLARRGEAGAVAYSGEALTAARRDGIGDGRDQWRRATAQALLGLGGVAFGELDLTDADVEVPSRPSTPTPSPTLPGDPRPTPEPTPAPTPGAEDRDGQRSGSPRVPALPQTPVTSPSSPLPVSVPVPGAPVQEAAAVELLRSRLTDGTHVRTTVDGEEFVDHAATADLLFALHAIEAPATVTRPVTRFLLTPTQVDAWARAADTEQEARYALPLARLALVADLSEVPGDDRRARRLRAELVDLVDGDHVVDFGQVPDAEDDPARLGWVTLALEAGGAPEADAVRSRLTDLACPGGGWAATGVDCAAGDPRTTTVVHQALTLRRGTTDETLGPAAVAALDRSTHVLQSREDPGRSPRAQVPRADVALAVMAAGQLPARPVTTPLTQGTTAALATGDLASVVGASARRLWSDATVSPFMRVSTTTVADSPPASSHGRPRAWDALLVLAGAVLGALLAGGVHRRLRRSGRSTQSLTPSGGIDR